MRRHEPYELRNFGVFWTDRRCYAPLDVAQVTLECHDPEVAECQVQVADGLGRTYHETELSLSEGVARFAVTVGGAPGLHVIRGFREGGPNFGSWRMGSFMVRARTHVSVPGTGLDGFSDWLDESLQATLDPALYDGQRIWGDKCADNSPMNLACPRFRLNTTVYFDQAEVLKGQLDLLFEHQQPDGSLYDHLYGDGHLGWAGERMIRSMMADMEIGAIINVRQVWLATADLEWLTGLLEPMLRAWEYATNAPELWSAEHGLIKRPHTPDEWDLQTGDGSCFRNENSRYVIALCDAVRLPKAAEALAEMLRAAGRSETAAGLRQFAADARERARALLWDGTKFRHHVHLDGIDHDDFDEAAQLAMSNTWACSDGLAEHAQALSIIGEYDRRLAETGDRYPWWSLQPGYPEGWFPQYPPGMYCNGGLFPWVGGELCRGCFQHGLPERGWELLSEFMARVQADSGACQTWYTLDGEPAANTHWTTNYDAWGIAAWGQAAIEGLAGVKPTAPGLEACVCTPQWQALGAVQEARVCVAMPASLGYLAYEYRRGEDGPEVTVTGSGEDVELRLPLPDDVPAEQVTLDGQPLEPDVRIIHGQRCLCLSLNPARVRRLQVR